MNIAYLLLGTNLGERKNNCIQPFHYSMKHVERLLKFQVFMKRLPGAKPINLPF
jgi:hypothetical protein